MSKLIYTSLETELKIKEIQDKKEISLSSLFKDAVDREYDLIFSQDKSLMKEDIIKKKEEAERLLKEAKEAEVKSLELEQIEKEYTEKRKREEEEYKNSEERWDKIKEMQRSAFFKLFITPTEEDFNEYWELLRNKKVKNLNEFAEKTNLIKKEIKLLEEDGDQDTD